jgi:hypothetical protein
LALDQSALDQLGARSSRIDHHSACAASGMRNRMKIARSRRRERNNIDTGGRRIGVRARTVARI